MHALKTTVHSSVQKKKQKKNKKKTKTKKYNQHVETLSAFRDDETTARQITSTISKCNAHTNSPRRDVSKQADKARSLQRPWCRNETTHTHVQGERDRAMQLRHSTRIPNAQATADENHVDLTVTLTFDNVVCLKRCDKLANQLVLPSPRVFAVDLHRALFEVRG